MKRMLNPISECAKSMSNFVGGDRRIVSRRQRDEHGEDGG